MIAQYMSESRWMEGHLFTSSISVFIIHKTSRKMKNIPINQISRSFLVTRKRVVLLFLFSFFLNLIEYSMNI